MEMKKLLVFMALVAASVSSVMAQQALTDDITALVGKSVSEAPVAAFVTKMNVDAQTGISYDNGIQLFKDKSILYEIYLFNAIDLNGQAMKAYKGALPFGISFKETTESLTKKIGVAPEAYGEHFVWNIKGQRLEVAFKDEKKTEISFISLSTL